FLSWSLGSSPAALSCAGCRGHHHPRTSSTPDHDSRWSRHQTRSAAEKLPANCLCIEYAGHTPPTGTAYLSSKRFIVCMSLRSLRPCSRAARLCATVMHCGLTMFEPTDFCRLQIMRLSSRALVRMLLTTSWSLNAVTWSVGDSVRP